MSEAEWEKQAKKRIFFGHQSVGYNIIEGVRELLKEYPAIRITIVETDDPDRFDDPVFAHTRVGINGDPASKLEDFERFLESGIGNRADIAIIKFCYVDVNQETDVDKMFATYQASIRNVKAKYPGLTLVNVTISLTSNDDSLKTRLKGWVKSLIGRKDPWRYANVSRHRLNVRIRKEYGRSSTLFDIAAIESSSPSGGSFTFSYNGQDYPCMYPGYTTDGGHLNDVGKRIVAERLLLLLAKIAEGSK